MSRPAGVPAQRGAVRVVAVWLVVLAASAAGVPPASARADLQQAQPAAGVGLSQAPSAVVLRFSEPLDRRLSRIFVLDGGGSDVAEGPTLAVVGDPQAMRRRLDRVGRGNYQVRWTSVSRGDGQLRRGAYVFAVGTSAEGVDAVASGPTASAGRLGVVGRLVGLLGLLLWVGLGLLAPLAGRAGVPPARSARLQVAAPAAALVGFGLAAAAAAQVATGSLGSVGAVLSGSPPGRWRLTGLALAAVAVPVAAWAYRRARGPTPALHLLVTALGLAALVAEAAAGHAATSAHPVRAVVVLAAHLGAVAVWLAALTLALLAGRTVVALGVLSPAIIGAAVVVVASGEAAAAAQLTSLTQLTGTGYGRAVLAKVAVLAAMTLLALAHYVLRRRERPPTGTVREVVRLELVAGGLAVALAAALVGFPDTPRQQAGGVDLAAEVSPLARLAGRAAVTLAQSSGPFIVGLALSPPRPGPVRVDVTVLGAEPGDGLRAARLSGRLATGAAGGATGRVSAALTPCGFGCFTGRADIPSAGPWRLGVALTSNRGAVSVTDTVPLPAPDGTALLAKTVAAMQRLRSARVSETLRGATSGPQARTISTYNAPSATRFDIAGGGSTVLIGDTTWSRASPTAPWLKSTSAAPFVWPAQQFAELFQDPVAIRLLAVDPARARAVVGFARPDASAWFRLTVDTGTGRLIQLHMRATGHLMDRTYTAYDSAPRIVPPS